MKKLLLTFFLAGLLILLNTISFASLKVEYPLSSDKILMFVAPSNFQENEYLTTREMLEKLGAEVDVASTTLEVLSGTKKLKVKPDMLIPASIEAENYSAVIVIGGPGVNVFFDYPPALFFIKSAYENKKVIGGIGLGPLVLGNAGILKNRKATVWWGARKELVKLGAIYTGKTIEKDGNIITARNSTAAKDFSWKIAKTLIYLKNSKKK